MAGSPDLHLAPEPTLRTGGHRLPLISVLLACVFPVFFLVFVVSGGLFQGGDLPVPLAYLLPALSVAAILGALGTGHRALAHARQYPAAQAGRGLAITALVLGYLSLTLVLLLVVWLFGAALSGGLGE